MADYLKEISAKLLARMHQDVRETARWLQSVVLGYFQYFAVPRNRARLKAFRNDILRMWLQQLRRRSQRSRWTWERLRECLAVLIPAVQILHPYPNVRFDAKHPR